jgi:uncharacterized protein YbjT (DUF2867 family)
VARGVDAFGDDSGDEGRSDKCDTHPAVDLDDNSSEERAIRDRRAEQLERLGHARLLAVAFAGQVDPHDVAAGRPPEPRAGSRSLPSGLSAPSRGEDGMKGLTMKIVVIGGTGLIGSKLVNKLREQGHQAVPASPDTGVNTLTGEGLAEALDGAAAVVDVSNSPSSEDAAALEFFKTSTRNLLDAEAAAGVGHHVALSIVGDDRLSESGYMRAKIAQEKLIEESSIPYSIVHATQFFEFVTSIADAATDGDTVRLAPVLIQPMAAEDVASAVATISVGPPVCGIVEVAGPEQFRLDEFVRRGLRERHDPREVITDPHARYFGAELNEHTLVPWGKPRIAPTRFEDWLSGSTTQQRPPLSLKAT